MIVRRSYLLLKENLIIGKSFICFGQRMVVGMFYLEFFIYILIFYNGNICRWFEYFIKLLSDRK